jgi:hypothetical protein
MPAGLTVSGQAVACARFLPAPLIAARAAAFDPLLCQDLSFTARRVLYGCLTFLNIKKPEQAIFPKRDLLRAESLLQSIPTLYRGLAELAAKGYISREQIRFRRTGEFHVSQITFMEKALVLLGLTKVIHRARSSTMIDGHIKKERTKELQSLQNTTGAPEASESPRIDPATRLPEALLPLTSLGVKKSAVCWLMSESKKHGKRLEDIMRSSLHRLTGLRGRAVVAYLRSLLGKEIDFSWLAKERHMKENAAKEEGDVHRALASLDRRYDGFEVFTADGRGLGIFRAGEGAEAMIESRSGVTPVNLRVAKAWSLGKIVLRPPESDLSYSSKLEFV